VRARISLTVLKTCRVGEASIAFSSRILILSSRTLRVRVSIVTDYVKGARTPMEVEFRAAGSRAGSVHGLRRMYVEGLMENRSLGLNRVGQNNVHVIPMPHHAGLWSLSIQTAGQNSEEGKK